MRHLGVTEMQSNLRNDEINQPRFTKKRFWNMSTFYIYYPLGIVRVQFS
jgi:hypothetical protein